MNVIFAAGGTGGHVIPALTLAKHIRRQNPQAQITFVGTPKGMESDLVPKEGFNLELLSLSGVKGKGLFARLRALGQLPGAFIRAWTLLHTYKPDVVFGIGGYASGPILLLASCLGYTTGILEPNAVPGLANRILSRFVSRIYLGFQEAQKHFSPSRSRVVGNIIRPDILSLPPPSFERTPWRILIFGGSQGAQKINRAVSEMLPSLIERSPQPLHFVHQTGLSDLAEVRSAYAKVGCSHQVEAFFDPMAKAYEGAHIVIARSGSSVLEIASVGIPAILIPYPYSADNHQAVNAQVIVEAGAAVSFPDQDLTGQKLLDVLLGLLLDKERLKNMSQRARALRRDGVLEAILTDLSDMVAQRKA